MILLSIFSGTGLVQFLIALLIIAIVVYAIKLLLDYLNIPQPMYKFIWLIIAVVVIIYLVNRFAGGLNI